MDLNELLTPTHGKPFDQAPGSYYRELHPDGWGQGRLCACLDCQRAHQAAMRTPDSPFHQGMVVRTPAGVGVVYQTTPEWTHVDLAEHRLLYVVKFRTRECREVVTPSRRSKWS